MKSLRFSALKTSALPPAGFFLQAFLLALSLVVADQAVKYLVSASFLNTSGPFSLPFTNNAWILIETLLLSLLTFLFFSLPGRRWGLLLIISGGLSNLLTRIFFSGVIDVWQVGSAFFNLADLTILLGLGLVAMKLLQK